VDDQLISFTWSLFTWFIHGGEHERRVGTNLVEPVILSGSKW